MAVLALILAATGVPESAAADPMPALARDWLRSPEGCDPPGHSANEIVVCGNKDAGARYRLRPVNNPHGFGVDGKPIRAQKMFGANSLGITNEQKKVGGFPSNRIMLTLKIPF